MATLCHKLPVCRYGVGIVEPISGAVIHVGDVLGVRLYIGIADSGILRVVDVECREVRLERRELCIGNKVGKYPSACNAGTLACLVVSLSDRKSVV